MLLSIFVLIEGRDECVQTILRKNAEMLAEIVGDFEPKGRQADEMEDFSAFREVLLGALSGLQA